MDSSEDVIATNGAGPEVEGVGAMLRSRRIELGLSQADVAGQVKLPMRRIEAMEQERWDELPDGPYRRGFLRNVARALNLDAELLMDRVDASVIKLQNPDILMMVPQGPMHGTLPRRSGPADDRRGGRPLVVGALAFALVAALIAWSGTRSFEHLVNLAKGSVEPATRLAASTPVSPDTDPLPTPTPPPSVSPAEATDVVASPAPADSTVALLFHFNEESWVEVKSADGKVLMKQLNAAGSELTVDGEAPYSLIVGNAKGVALRFRGQAVDLAPYTRDSVARFTLS